MKHILSLSFIFLFFIIYFYTTFYKKYYKYNLIFLQNSKKLIKETKGYFKENLLQPPIIPIKNMVKLKLPINIKSSPIILIPDICGSKLYYKNKLKLNLNWKKIWFNINYFFPQTKKSNDWNYKIKPILVNHMLSNQKNILISPYRESNYKGNIFNITRDYGGIEGITFFQKIGNSILYEFDPLIQFLIQNCNYKSANNLFAASYDFRLISNKNNLHFFFKKLKDLIEYSYYNNNDKSFIVASGLGGILFILFINYYLPKELGNNHYLIWKKLRH